MLDKNNSAESPKAVAPQPNRCWRCNGSGYRPIQETFGNADVPCPACNAPIEAPRVEGELPPRPKLQGGDYRPHYRQDQTDAYISALERIVKNSHGGAFLVEDLKKGLPELSLLAEEEEN